MIDQQMSKTLLKARTLYENERNVYVEITFVILINLLFECFDFMHRTSHSFSFIQYKVKITKIQLDGLDLVEQMLYILLDSIKKICSVCCSIDYVFVCAFLHSNFHQLFWYLISFLLFVCNL